MEPVDRYLADRVAGGYAVAESGCWIWKLAVQKEGYGRVKVGRRLEMAHRVAYEAYVGPIPAGLHLDHLCRTRACINPEHLEPVTRRENIRRGEGWAGLNAQKTECVNGHPFTPDNTIVRKRTGEGRDHQRECRTCKLRRTNEWRARRKAVA